MEENDFFFLIDRTILNLAVTLDGFIEGPNGELDWLTRDSNIDFADILNEIMIHFMIIDELYGVLSEFGLNCVTLFHGTYGDT